MAHAQSDTDGNFIDDLNKTAAANENGHANHEASDEVAEAAQKPIDEIESLCMNCHENVCVPWYVNRVMEE